MGNIMRSYRSFGDGDNTVFYDTATDTEGTLLGAHTPDIGTGWTEVITHVNDPEIEGGEVVSKNQIGGQCVWMPDELSSGDFELTCDWTNGPSNGYGGGPQWRILTRDVNFDDDRTTMHIDNSIIYCTVYSGGSNVYSDSDSSLGDNKAVTRAIKVRCLGSDVKVWVDDNLLFQYTDTWNTTNKNCAFRFYNPVVKFDNYKITLL